MIAPPFEYHTTTVTVINPLLGNEQSALRIDYHRAGEVDDWLSLILIDDMASPFGIEIAIRRHAEAIA